MPFKGFSIGFNASYLFGNITNDVYAYLSQGDAAVFEQRMEVQDFHFRFGAQYTYNISRRNSVTVGVTYEPGKDLLGKTYVLKYLQNSTSAPDTIAPGIIRLHSRFSLASSYGIGVAYDWNNRLHAEVDFTYQPWKDAKYTQLENFSATRLDNRWKVVFYNRDYIMVGDNHVRDYGVSVGFGFPAVSSKTLVNLGFEYRNRQATPVAMLKEQYFNITLGVNFNQVWFLQSKLR